jgi:uncharacterized protein
MKSNMDRKYIDSNIFVQGILRGDERCKEVILKIARGEFSGVTSVLSWDEIVFVISKFLGKDIGIREGRKFFDLPNIEFVDVRKETILLSQKLVEKYGLKPRDAIHSATAISMKLMEIVSEDKDFDKVLELKRVNP